MLAFDVARQVSLRELLVGVEGLAILRRLYDGTDAAADRRLAELREVLDSAVFDHAEVTPEHDPRPGYALWSDSYDEPDNPIVALEEVVVKDLIGSRPLGSALDAACGTGRHAAQLVRLGHRVLGIDLTPEMLDRARERVPAAEFRRGICGSYRPATRASTWSSAAWRWRTYPSSMALSGSLRGCSRRGAI
jgi:SAM-dependent methyltransferase